MKLKVYVIGLQIFSLYNSTIYSKDKKAPFGGGHSKDMEKNYRNNIYQPIHLTFQ